MHHRPSCGWTWRAALEHAWRFAQPDAGGQLRRQSPVVRRRDRQRADGRHNRPTGAMRPVTTPTALTYSHPARGDRRLRRECARQRPSVRAATGDRRRAQPSSTAMMGRSRALVVVMSGGSRSSWDCRIGKPGAGPDADRLRALRAGDAGGQFRRQQPVVRHRDRRRADGDAPRGRANTVLLSSD